MKVNANLVLDAMELLRAVANKLDYCPELYEVQRLLIASLAPAPKAHADAIDDELVEVTATGFGRIIEKPTNRQFSE